MLARAVLLAWMTATTAAAQDGTAEEARARRHAEAGRFAEAAAEYERAYAVAPRDALLYEAFAAYRDAGNTPEAADALRRYLATDHATEERRASLVAQLAVLEREHARAGAPRAAEAREETSALVVMGGVIAGLGGAALIASIPTGVLALEGAAHLDEACPRGVCPREEQPRVKETETLGVATDVLWVSGAVAVGAGVAILVVGLVVGPPSGTAANVGPTIACASDGCVAGVTGWF